MALTLEMQDQVWLATILILLLPSFPITFGQVFILKMFHFNLPLCCDWQTSRVWIPQTYFFFIIYIYVLSSGWLPTQPAMIITGKNCPSPIFRPVRWHLRLRWLAHNTCDQNNRIFNSAEKLCHYLLWNNSVVSYLRVVHCILTGCKWGVW